MKIPLTIKDIYRSITFPVTVESDTRIEVLKLKISSSQNINFNKILLSHNQSELDKDNKKMSDYKIKPNDIVVLSMKGMRRTNFNNPQEEAAYLIEKCSVDSGFLEKLLSSQPQLAEAVLSENTLLITTQLNRTQQNNPNNFGNFQNPFNQGNFNNPNMSNFGNPNNSGYGNPNMSFGNSFSNNMDPQRQRQIEEQIQKNRLNQLQTETYENYPELFVPTEMLFIKGSINKQPLDIFVDTGAQTTVISKKFAERANILKNVDARYAGKVVGVGTSNSLGRIWQAYMEIEGRFFVISCVVLDGFSHDVLLGLDMMKRHRCIIDLTKNELLFSLEGVKTKFLKDHEVSMNRRNDLKGKLDFIMSKLGVDEKEAHRLLLECAMDEDKAVVMGKKK